MVAVENYRLIWVSRLINRETSLNNAKMVYKVSWAIVDSGQRVTVQCSEAVWITTVRVAYTGCLNKKETWTNEPISLKLDKHLSSFGYCLLDGYPVFPTVPRNVGSVMSVNENEHFKNRLTI